MTDDSRRALTRMLANYVRLLMTLCLGLLLARLLLRAVGDDGFGLVAFLGSATGLAATLEQIVARSLIRELAAVYHSNSRSSFVRLYNASLLLCAIVAVFTLAIAGLLVLLLPVFGVPGSLFMPAVWFVVAKGIQSFAMIILSPPCNMYLVTERMIAYNTWPVIDRMAMVVPAAILVALDSNDTGMNIVAYGLGSAILTIFSRLTAAATIVIQEPLLRPRLSRASRASAWLVVRAGGWNTAVATAINMHIRLDNLIMFFLFGPLGGRLFGLATQLTSYARMVATGVTTGLDAVSARISSTDSDSGLKRLLHHSTQLHGLVSFPATIGIFLLAEPLIRIWVGHLIQDSSTEIPMITTIIRVLCVGVAVRSVSDGWVMILYGAGHIRAYAPTVMFGAVCNPVLAILLVNLLPESIRYTGPAWSFSLIFVVIHLVTMAVIVARTVDVTIATTVAPLFRPLAVALICAPILLGLRSWIPIEQWGVFELISAIVTYAVAYGLLAWFVVLPAFRRRQFIQAIRSRGMFRGN